MSDLPMAPELFVQMRRVEDRAYQKGWEQGRRNFVRNIDYEAAIRLVISDEYEPYDEPYTIHELMVRRIVDAAFGIGGDE